MDVKWASSDGIYHDFTFLIDNPHQKIDTGFPYVTVANGVPFVG